MAIRRIERRVLVIDTNRFGKAVFRDDLLSCLRLAVPYDKKPDVFVNNEAGRPS